MAKRIPEEIAPFVRISLTDLHELEVSNTHTVKVFLGLCQT